MNLIEISFTIEQLDPREREADPIKSSVEPTAYAASVRIGIDSLFNSTVSSARLPRPWLSSIS